MTRSEIPEEVIRSVISHRHIHEAVIVDITAGYGMGFETPEQEDLFEIGSRVHEKLVVAVVPHNQVRQSVVVYIAPLGAM